MTTGLHEGVINRIIRIRSVMLAGSLLLLAACDSGDTPDSTTSNRSDDRISGPFYYRTPPAKVQDLDLLNPPTDYQPPQWAPGDPDEEPPDLVRQPGPDSRKLSKIKKAGPQGEFPVNGTTHPPDPARLSTGNLVMDVNVEGIPSTGKRVPDPVGDIGLSHYIQAVNAAFRIYDRSGAPITEAQNLDILWHEQGGPCAEESGYDPIVRYDTAADRWLISRFTSPGNGTVRYECIAISRTSDPVTGGWYLYEFPSKNLQDDTSFALDFPKISVWPDAYYMSSQRGYPDLGLDVWAFEREQMLNGNPALVVRFYMAGLSIVLLPADPDGPSPPTGAPGLFARQMDGERFYGEDRVEIYTLSVDWGTPANSSFGQLVHLPTLPFESELCVDDLLSPCIRQPGANHLLETLSAWPQWRLQYRNHESHQSLVFNHTVDINGGNQAGIRWYELRSNPEQGWSIHQQGTVGSTDLQRWMGSLAMDKLGNLALGYAVASDSTDNEVFPGIHISSRRVTDAPGAMPMAELQVISGGGFQSSGNIRYGNYSTLDVDPVDDCTFWYTHEYYPATSKTGWRTRIASFRFPECE